MTDKKWFTTEDVEMAKMTLDSLPDLTEKRLTKSDVLNKLQDQIILLSGHKGYSVDDIRSALEGVGIQTSVKAIREILSKQKKTTKGAGLSRNRTTKNSNRTPVNQES
ncbi:MULTISPECIES: molybdopterin-guanine dinucleotide biosynthesis protein MobC [Enterobacteriaceae]|uniref:Molybdopterin-guanine dinucleotide biosynthesis protein MobC n=2 Tax=Citrobacter freundii complex TaxID=1344959 RepID=A0ABR6U1G0_CITBR|nr:MULTISPECIES: molybdopterin-guanine dinucleotide biosynthesis protein MobC [Enterobacteriaceae]MBC2612947.1 molybdopterin-guanine dinucleotide biosynthesis protein MobC [Citrobacter braakii]MBC2636919.1 molybdopterin-guanine dinucleotide biosynthesis protein MobC [Citrobacter braakii]MBC2649638.1 molybdopterin-guanine dinucleotide biosynthesis protein MobC [Citrobacter braakii]MCL8106681.1 molybdopterin-guanine dinucleotide biosynthesis protein MobC [Enterobacter hormaechei]MCM8255735.1 mol